MKFRWRNDDGIEMHLDAGERKLIFDALLYYQDHCEDARACKICGILDVLEIPGGNREVPTREEGDSGEDALGVSGKRRSVIRRLRRARDITQRELADRLGVERSAVAKWEAGICLPRGETLAALAEVLGCSVDELAERGK